MKNEPLPSNTMDRSSMSLGTSEVETNPPEPRRSSQVGLLAIGKAIYKHRQARSGVLIIILFCLMAIFAPLLAPYDPLEQDLYNVFSSPSKAHWLGTDNIGRDLLSRIIYGSRATIGIAFSATIFAAIIGIFLGLLAGYRRGWVDMFIMRLSDAIMCLPGIVIVLLLSATLGAGFLNTAFAITVVGWTIFARIVRGQVIQIREMPYVEAARASGASGARLMFKHLLPNSMAPIIVAISLSMGAAILIESATSFLGLGVKPPTPSWGAELRFGFSYMEIVPLYSIAPGVMITLAIMAFNFVGDGFRDALDPRIRGEGKKQ